MMETLLKIEGVCKAYDEKTQVLKDLSLSVSTGERVAVVGASGCGKSTLLNLIGALDKPDRGLIEFDHMDVTCLAEKKAAAFRNERIGCIFQLHHLLPQCTVLENALIPSLVSKEGDNARNRALNLLERVGLADRLNHRPGQLSGGERQRVAVVRALINRPRLLLADEPTGALNREAADELMSLLLELNREESLTLIMVTHSMRLADKLDRVLTLEGGRLK